MKPKFFKTLGGENIPLPVFFPDATRGVVRSVDSSDIKRTKTPGVLVNTYHLINDLGDKQLEHWSGVSKFMNWGGGTISDSGGFQVMTLAKREGRVGKITNKGVEFWRNDNSKVLLTAERSIEFQAWLETDMVVVLDDFTPPGASRSEARETVERTILWARKSKMEFERIYEERQISIGKRPYILGVAQGGDYHDLRRECIERLTEIGFDGIGFGGWAIKDGVLDLELSRVIAEKTPKNLLLYGLGIGKPEDIVKLFSMGYQIFDCVLPTRDARHGRLYVYNSDSIDQIDLSSADFYSFYYPQKSENLKSGEPVSKSCDCHLCTNYSRSYLQHLFKIKDATAMRLSTIHNLRFYSILMEKLRS